MPMQQHADLPLDNLTPMQRDAFQTHLNDLWDDYADAMSSLAREAQTMVANATYDDGDPLANARAMLDRYARQANRLTLDYYRQVRSSWAEPRGKQSNSTASPLTKGDSSVQYSSSENQSRHVISCLSSSENHMLTTSLSS